ncbi:MAG: polysaccharide deacetylase family protein [Syntrophorhabdales bacterium]
MLYYHVVKREERGGFAKQMDAVTDLARPVRSGDLPALEGGRQYAAVVFDDAFHETLQVVLPELRRRNIPVTIFVPTGCLGLEPPWINDRASLHNGGRILAEDDIRQLAAAEPLVSFGSHCVTHRPLTDITDREAREEIFESKAHLETILGCLVEELSFPHCAFEQRHVDWALEAGYRRIYSVQPLLAFRNPRELVTGRFRVDPTDWPPEFRLKILGAYCWLSIRHGRE